MKNGNKSSPWFRLPNLERESVADLPVLSVVIWLTPFSTSFVRAVPGDCCPAILDLGRPFMATLESGVRIGPGGSFTTGCGTACARAKAERSRRRQLLWTARPSRPAITRGNAATTGRKRWWDENATWRWTAWE